MITYSGGFICSYGTSAVYILEQQPGDQLTFLATKKITFPPRLIQRPGESCQGYAIKSLSINPTEDLLVALTDDLLLFSYQLKKKEGTHIKKNVFSILLYPFHSAAVKGLDVCIRCEFIQILLRLETTLGLSGSL